MVNYYCGAKKVPKGKRLGSPEYCIKSNQIRYYGIKSVNPNLLQEKKGKNIEKERIKLIKINADAKRLIREFARVKKTIEDGNATPAQLNQAEKRRQSLLKQRDIIKKRLNDQELTVKKLEKEEKKKEKALKKQLDTDLKQFIKLEKQYGYNKKELTKMFNDSLKQAISETKTHR